MRFMAIVKANADSEAGIMPSEDMFWGDRYGQLEDPFSHRWSIATHVRDVTPDEIQQAAQHVGS